jgi:glycosyltransferase involved in cell wall biosynthesis
MQAMTSTLRAANRTAGADDAGLNTQSAPGRDATRDSAVWRGLVAAVEPGAAATGAPSGLGSTRVSVVIPTLNEAANLPHVMSRMPAWVHEVVIVDGHSTDDTIAIARALWPSVRIILQDSRGKGNALGCGFAAARGDIIVMLDADGSTDPAEIPLFIEPLLAGADFVKGSRRVDGGGSTDFSVLRRTGNGALTGLFNMFYGRQYTDLCYGYNAFWSRCLPHMRVDCDGFEVETLIHARVARAGLEVAEVPSMEHERLHGASNLRTFRDGRRVLGTMVSGRFGRARKGDSVEWDAPLFRELAA